MPRHLMIAALVGALLIPPPAVADMAAPVLVQSVPSAPGGAVSVPAAMRTSRFGVDLASPANPGGASVQPSTAAAVGAGWVRVAVGWDALEPARGRFVWAVLDDAVRRAGAAGEHLLVTIQQTPKWAALTPNAAEAVWSHQPPRSIADWTAFARAIVARYRGRVAAWQIEPELELTTFRGTTRDYLDMLHAARAEIRRADSDALVVASAPAGLDLPFVKLLFGRAGDDFDALMLYPRGQTSGELLEALTTLHGRRVADPRHEIWLSARAEWPQPVQLAVTALAAGVTREFWGALTPPVTTAVRRFGDAQFVGPLDRGPGVYAFVFETGQTPLAAAWTDGASLNVPLATTGAAVVTGADGQPRSVGQTGQVPLGPDVVFVANPATAVIDEAAKTLAAGPLRVPRDPARDFSKADNVLVTLGATNQERGLYNQELRGLRSGAVVPVTVDGVTAVRTDQQTDAVYVRFTIDASYAYFVDGRYDYLIAIEVHRAGGPQRVGFNLLYDSMSGYRFSPWQWVDAGDGWVSYTIRISDASFSKTWGWDFAINGAADKKENLVVHSVTVTRVPVSQATH
jgi:hypothetical protein